MSENSNKKNVRDLEYFAIYIPIKLTSINIPDLGRLENYAKIILNEHLFSTYVVSNVLTSIISVFEDDLNEYNDEIKAFFNDDFMRIVSYTGYKSSKLDIQNLRNGKEIILYMATVVSEMNRECRKYCTSIALDKNHSEPYVGPIADFMDFVYPLLLKLKSLPFFPLEKPFYLLMMMPVISIQLKRVY